MGWQEEVDWKIVVEKKWWDSQKGKASKFKIQKTTLEEVEGYGKTLQV